MESISKGIQAGAIFVAEKVGILSKAEAQTKITALNNKNQSEVISKPNQKVTTEKNEKNTESKGFNVLGKTFEMPKSLQNGLSAISSVLARGLGALSSKKTLTPEQLETKRKLDNFTVMLGDLPKCDRGLQKTNCENLRKNLHTEIAKNYDVNEKNQTSLGYQKKGKEYRVNAKGVSWTPKPSGVKENIFIKGEDKNGTARTIYITPKMIEEQKESTKIFIKDESKLTSTFVKDAARNGAEFDKRTMMRDRCVISKVPIFADVNGNIVPPKQVFMCVMSAQDTNELGGRRLDVDKYREEIKSSHNLFLNSSLNSGANFIVDCEFGQGAFANEAREVCNQIFVETWVSSMGQALEKFPNLQVGLGGVTSPIADLLKTELKSLNPSLRERITITDKSSLDVARIAAEAGFIPSTRIAGDASGQAGQFACQSEGMSHIAQEEVAGTTSMLMLQNIHVLDVEGIANQKVSVKTLTDEENQKIGDMKADEKQQVNIERNQVFANLEAKDLASNIVSGFGDTDLSANNFGFLVEEEGNNENS